MKIPKPFMCAGCQVQLPLRAPTGIDRAQTWQCTICNEIYWMAERDPHCPSQIEGHVQVVDPEIRPQRTSA